jgi:hypothetical protein
MYSRNCIRAHVGLGLLLSLHLASQCNAAAALSYPQQVALQPSLATWTEAAERCAALGQRLAPRELAAQAAAEDGRNGRVTQQCTSTGRGATVMWVDASDGNREAPLNLGGHGRHRGEQCQGLVFNHTSRQAQSAAEACDQRHCFLCSAAQAELMRKTTTSSTKSGRRLMVADSTNCNMAGQKLQRPHCLR